MMLIGFQFFRRSGGPLWMLGMDNRLQNNTMNTDSSAETPLENLQRRYASGGIGKAEYDEMR